MTTARMAEATGAPVEFEFEGVTYTIPPQSEWPFMVGLALEREKFFEAAYLILGERQVSRLNLGESEAFFEALGEALGGDPTQ